MWVCRAGKDAIYLKRFVERSAIYLTWNGFNIDLSSMLTTEDYRKCVIHEMDTDNHTSVSNWSGQLRSFHKDILVGDYVMVPYYGSRRFMLTRVTGEYVYVPDDEFPHSHAIEIVEKEIPAEIFPQDIRYSLRAYRTVYRVRNEDRIMEMIQQWKKRGELDAST